MIEVMRRRRFPTAHAHDVLSDETRQLRAGRACEKLKDHCLIRFMCCELTFRCCSKSSAACSREGPDLFIGSIDATSLTVLAAPLRVTSCRYYPDASNNVSKTARRLRIITALSLEKPVGKSELEEHFRSHSPIACSRTTPT